MQGQGLERGSRFEVMLPLVGEVPTAASGATPSPLAVKRSAQCCVLVADDVRDIADSVALMLEHDGHTVRLAFDGERALQLAEAWWPDVVLLDIGMPVTDGNDVCRRIRAAPWGAAIVQIAPTGWDDEGDRRETAAARFDHHLVEPLDFDALTELLSARTAMA